MVNLSLTDSEYKRLVILVKYPMSKVARYTKRKDLQEKLEKAKEVKREANPV